MKTSMNLQMAQYNLLQLNHRENKKGQSTKDLLTKTSSLTQRSDFSKTQTHQSKKRSKSQTGQKQ
jgi:hypothetical protein